MGDNELQEVKPLREVPRTAECCGQRMRLMTHPSVTGTGMKRVNVCDKCGTQQQLPTEKI